MSSSPVRLMNKTEDHPAVATRRLTLLRHRLLVPRGSVPLTTILLGSAPTPRDDGRVGCTAPSLRDSPAPELAPKHTKQWHMAMEVFSVKAYIRHAGHDMLRRE